MLRDIGTDLDSQLVELRAEKKIRDEEGLLMALPTFSQTTVNPQKEKTTIDNSAPENSEENIEN
jgi:hypothetical protein